MNLRKNLSEMRRRAVLQRRTVTTPHQSLLAKIEQERERRERTREREKGKERERKRGGGGGGERRKHPGPARALQNGGG